MKAATMEPPDVPETTWGNRPSSSRTLMTPKWYIASAPPPLRHSAVLPRLLCASDIRRRVSGTLVSKPPPPRGESILSPLDFGGKPGGGLGPRAMESPLGESPLGESSRVMDPVTGPVASRNNSPPPFLETPSRPPNALTTASYSGVPHVPKNLTLLHSSFTNSSATSLVPVLACLSRSSRSMPPKLRCSTVLRDKPSAAASPLPLACLITVR